MFCHQLKFNCRWFEPKDTSFRINENILCDHLIYGLSRRSLGNDQENICYRLFNSLTIECNKHLQRSKWYGYPAYSWNAMQNNIARELQSAIEAHHRVTLENVLTLDGH